MLTYFECRFARWIDDDTVAYIGKDHDTYTYAISEKKRTKLFAYPYEHFGAIPNRQRTWAVDGKNRVYEIVDPGPSGTLRQVKDLDGCEGDFSDDGRWLYRVAEDPHDIPRVEVGGWSSSIIFENHDAALPVAQNYIYFPKISANQRYLALAASPNTHDHFNADYDIFLVAIDPLTFEKKGEAVKFSFSTALDSYPDIWTEASGTEESSSSGGCALGAGGARPGQGLAVLVLFIAGVALRRRGGWRARR